MRSSRMRACDWSASRRAGAASELGEHAARFSGGSPGVLHGAYSYVLQDDDGQIALTHSVSAGLDYALGRSGARLAARHGTGRIRHRSRDDEALEAARLLSRTEGIIPALESAHAVAEAIRRAPAAKGETFRHQSVRPRRQRHRYLPREHLKESG